MSQQWQIRKKEVCTWRRILRTPLLPHTCSMDAQSSTTANMRVWPNPAAALIPYVRPRLQCSVRHAEAAKQSHRGSGASPAPGHQVHRMAAAALLTPWLHTFPSPDEVSALENRSLGHPTAEHTFQGVRLRLPSSHDHLNRYAPSGSYERKEARHQPMKGVTYYLLKALASR